MAESAATTNASETLIEAEPSTQDMDLETPIAATEEQLPAADSKRSREDSGEDSAGAKKLKVEKSAEEDRLDQLEGTEGDKESDRVSVGPKSFVSSVDMFDYFYKFLHYWAPNVNVNKFEQMVLLELLKKGYPEPEKKIGNGISAFQVRFHPQFKSRCFFIIRNDESVDDFSFRKCVDRILPLPENMLAKSDVNKALGGGGGGHGKRGGGGGGGGGGHGRGYGRGRGRGGKLKN
ncbi:unnamed protein product [Camellia sinensis]